MLEMLETLINSLNNVMYTYILSFALCAVGIYFTIRTRGIQFHIKDMIKNLLEDTTSKSSEHNRKISPFEAFAITTASRVGTGNLAGVSLAVVAGGPGALFWMWITALIGGALSFSESTLAQIYKISNPQECKNTSFFQGGPAYYIDKGLSLKWLANIFSVILIFVFGYSFNAVQSNTIAHSFSHTFSLSPLFVGILLAGLTGIVIFKGLSTIAKISAFLVPIMSLFYIVLSLIVIIINIERLPEVFSMIFSSAFGLREASVGVLAGTISTGIKRGLFSNEAGMGSAPNAAASADTSHPVKQGLIQAFGVFFDTILICSTTGFLILFSGISLSDPNVSGIILTQNALALYFGKFGSLFLSIAIFLLAFSSILGNYFYAINSITLLSRNKNILLLFKCSVIFIVFLGAISSLNLVWNIADLLMGIMTLINLYAIVRLSKILKICLDDYLMQKKEKKSPVFQTKNWNTQYPTLFKNIDEW